MKTSDVIPNTDIDENCGCQTGADMNYKQPEMDHEVQMARSELYRAANSAIELHKMLRMINEKQGIEGWVAAKITKAADYLESVYHYLDYEMRFDNGDLDEQATIGSPGAPAATSTPGMVKMAKVGPDGKPQGTPIIVAASQISAKQKQGMKVIGESSSAGATSSGSIAATANGFAKGGPGTMTRAKKVKEEVDDEGWYAHHEIHGDKGISKEDWKKGWRLNSKGQRVQIKKESGTKFTGYWKGKDKGRPGKKMVGSD